MREARGRARDVRKWTWKNAWLVAIALVVAYLLTARSRVADEIEEDLARHAIVEPSPVLPQARVSEQQDPAVDGDALVSTDEMASGKEVPEEPLDDDDDKDGQEVSLECPAPPFKLLEGKGSVILLASFPGSGNTWIRHLLQRGSGVLTGSVYKDQSLYTEFPAESVRDATVIAVKTHYPCAACWEIGPPGKKTLARESQTGVLPGYKATIQVLRSPFGAMLSDFNHWRSGANHTGVASREDFESEIFDDFVLTRIKTWTRHAKFYLNTKSRNHDPKKNNIWLDSNGKPVLLIYYEDLKRDTAREMAKIFRFIKRFSDKDSPISKIDPVKAGKCSIAMDAVGGFKRVQSRSKPFDRIPPGSDKSLKETVCNYALANASDFWKHDDPEWYCDS